MDAFWCRVQRYAYRLHRSGSSSIGWLYWQNYQQPWWQKDCYECLDPKGFGYDHFDLAAAAICGQIALETHAFLPPSTPLLSIWLTGQQNSLGGSTRRAMIIGDDMLLRKVWWEIGRVNATINLLRPRLNSNGNQGDGRRSGRNNHQGRRRTWKKRRRWKTQQLLRAEAAQSHRQSTPKARALGSE